MCILFRKSNQCSEFLQFLQFQNNLSNKKKKSRNIGFHGPLIHQTKLEIKTNILMYYRLIWCNISGVLFCCWQNREFFHDLPSTLHSWLQSLKNVSIKINLVFSDSLISYKEPTSGYLMLMTESGGVRPYFSDSFNFSTVAKRSLSS